ncbi:hypothetical protein TSAR_002987, partial [Trichomalopsis sarcophagae]
MRTLIYESMYKHDVLTDSVLFKCNYCVKSVINVLKVINDEFCTDISTTSRLVKLFRNRQRRVVLYGFGVEKY